MAALDCGHEPRPEDVTYYTAGTVLTVGDRQVTMTGAEVMFSGTARDHEDRTCCYPCADARMRDLIETADALTVYDKDDPQTRYGTVARGHVTTWNGTTLGIVIRRSTYRNGLTGRPMVALTVRTPRGRILTGRYGPDWSEAVTLRPTKRTAR